MARWLRYNAPGVKLRLFSSSQETADRLRAAFPDCEVVVANYFDLPSLAKAVAGIEGLFVSCPFGTDEQKAMTNLIEAVRSSGTLIHMIRTLGMFPNIHPRRIPSELKESGMGLEIQHPIARQLLEESDLPVTFFNIGASFMDNFLHPFFDMLSPGRVTWPNRRVPMIDPREIGEAAAKILLSDNARHIHQFHTLNNNHDNVYMSDMAKLMSEVLLLDIKHDASKEGLNKLLSPKAPGLAEGLWKFFRYEDANDVAWALNDFLERTLGRKPNTVRSWMQEHRVQLAEKLRMPA
jgi:uncharacterized protein YbjT (DUF2867 family)